MRTAKITLAGHERTLAFSARVITAATDEYGSLQGFFDALQSKDQGESFRAVIWALSRMMDAGARYDRLQGLEPPPPMDVDELLDLCDFQELSGISSKILETITAGSAREVEAIPPKNGKATRGKKTAAP